MVAVGSHGAGSTAAEGALGLGYDGARGAVPSIAPRGVDTRPHGHGTRAAHATSGRSSDVAPAPGGDALGPSALGGGGFGSHGAGSTAAEGALGLEYDGARGAVPSIAPRGVDTRPHGRGTRAAHATPGSSNAASALGGVDLGQPASGVGGYGDHGAGSTAAEVALGLGYDGARGAVPSVAPRGVNTRPHGHGTRAAHATPGSSDVASALGGVALGQSALGGGGFGSHGAGSTAAEVALGLGYDGARGAVPSVAPRGVDTRPHGHGTRAAHATSGRSSDVAPALGGVDLGPSALGGGGFGSHGAGSTAAEGALGLEYDGARGAVPSIAPRGVDTRPHGRGTRLAYATSGRSSDVAPAPDVAVRHIGVAAEGALGLGHDGARGAVP